MATYTAAQQTHIDNLRVLLGDGRIADTTKYNWSDAELFLFLQSAVDDFNLFPPRTQYTIADIPLPVAMYYGGIIFALINRGIFEIGREFNYNTKGVSITFERSSKYQSWVSQLLAFYDRYRQLKVFLGEGRSFSTQGIAFGERPGAGGLGLSTLLDIGVFSGAGKSSRTLK